MSDTAASLESKGSAAVPSVPAIPVDTSAREAAQGVIRSYALEAAWPTDQADALRSLAFRLATDLARLFSREVTGLSIGDLERAQAKIPAIASSLGIKGLRLSTAVKAVQAFDRFAPIYKLVMHLYAAGAALHGDMGPLVKRLGANVGGQPLARAAGVWFAGQILVELYWDLDGYQSQVAKSKASPPPLDPLFASLPKDRLRELATFMGIEALVKWDEVKLKTEIESTIRAAYHNKLQALWADTPSYQNVLLCLCEEMDIPDYRPSDAIELLEARIVHRVFALSTKDLTPERARQYEAAVGAHARDNYWNASLKSGAALGGIALGNMIGFPLYVTASTALAAVSNGLGLSLGFAAYTTMSSAIATILGPVGIGLAGTAAVFQWTRARPKQALPFVLYMAALRAEMQLESERRVSRWRRIKAWIRTVLAGATSEEGGSRRP